MMKEKEEISLPEALDKITGLIENNYESIRSHLELIKILDSRLSALERAVEHLETKTIKEIQMLDLGNYIIGLRAKRLLRNI